ncbi:hypothetical protein F444_05228 [Phytophthora nicotianae P1976]|uniref:RxLR effector protein n=1 Tax=Phytophthora nicotianae P1976 TaxID=1317066 RepID=A0A081AMS4_PHYNI|nr:hypothetical protein F444_05228 [Phytophthora nicotianae P1976]
MRLLYLLVVVVTLVGSCGAISTPSKSGARTRFSSEVKTLLRSLKAKSVSDTDDKIEEERAGGNLAKVDDLAEMAANKLADDIVDDIPKLVTTFENWKQLTGTEAFKTPVAVKLAEASEAKWWKVYNLYGEFNLLGKKAFIEKLEHIKKQKLQAPAQR